MLRVGDKVFVTDKGKQYSTYDTWFAQAHAPAELEINWKLHKSHLENDDVVEIVFIEPYQQWPNATICAVQTADGSILLIATDGLDLIPTVNPTESYSIDFQTLLKSGGQLNGTDTNGLIQDNLPKAKKKTPILV